jgi:hypothetical protein
LSGLSDGLRRITKEDTTRFSPPAAVNLRLDDPALTGNFSCQAASLFGGCGDPARRNRDTRLG